VFKKNALSQNSSDSSEEVKSSQFNKVVAENSSIFMNPFMPDRSDSPPSTPVLAPVPALAIPETPKTNPVLKPEKLAVLEKASSKELIAIIWKLTEQGSQTVRQRTVHLQENAKAMHFLHQRCLSLEKDNKKLYKALVEETRTSVKFREKFAQAAAGLSNLQQSIKHQTAALAHQQQLQKQAQQAQIQQQQMAQIQQQLNVLQQHHLQRTVMPGAFNTGA